VRVYAVAANLFVDVDEGPAETLLGLAQLARFAPPLVHFGFHSNPAWQLLADTRKASSNNSKITFIPPDTQQYAMLRVSYRSFNENVVQQYSGSWVDQLRLATDSDLTGAVLCFNPEVYSPFQGKAAFNFRESPWNNNGIEIKAVSEVQLPSITTTALPAAVVDESYEFTFSAAGDAPFSWRLVHAPAGMTIDHMSGEISFMPEQEDTPFVSVTVRLDNDSGSDTQTFNLVVDDSAPTDGGSGDSGADAGAEDGAVADQGTTEAGGDGNSGDAGDGGDDDGGCCSTSGGGGGPALAAVLLLLFLGRRRRARR